MGTRNLTEVKVNDKIKIAQYGQWDGYPTGQGQTIVDFLKTVDLEKFKKQVEALGEYTEAALKKASADAGSDGSGWMTMDVAKKLHEAHPALNRDYGAGILQLVHDGKVSKMVLRSSFKEDELFCEYAYMIDLDKETVTVSGRVKTQTFTFKQWTKGLMKKLQAERD